MRAVFKALSLAAAVTLMSLATAQAQQYGQSGASGLSDAEIDKRLNFIEQRLEGSRSHGWWWQYGWLSVSGASMVGNGVAAGTVSNHDDRIYHSVSAVQGAIGVAHSLLDPMEARKGADPIRDLPGATREQKLAKLRAAEDLLKRNAERAETRWGWKEHLGNAVLAGAAGGIVAWQGEEGHALEVGLTGFLGGVAKLLTQPWAPEGDWEDYKRMTGGQQSMNWGVSVAALPEGGAMLNMKIEW